MRKGAFTRLPDEGDATEPALAARRPSVLDSFRTVAESLGQTREPPPGSGAAASKHDQLEAQVKKDVQTLRMRLHQSDFRRGASRDEVAVDWVKEHCPVHTDMETVLQWNQAMMKVLAPSIAASDTSEKITALAGHAC